MFSSIKGRQVDSLLAGRLSVCHDELLSTESHTCGEFSNYPQALYIRILEESYVKLLTIIIIIIINTTTISKIFQHFMHDF